MTNYNPYGPNPFAPRRRPAAPNHQRQPQVNDIPNPHGYGPNPFRQRARPPPPPPHRPYPANDNLLPWAPTPRFHETLFREPHADDEAYAAQQAAIYAHYAADPQPQQQPQQHQQQHQQQQPEPLPPPPPPVRALGRAGNAGTAGPPTIPPLLRLALFALASAQLLGAGAARLAAALAGALAAAGEFVASTLVPGVLALAWAVACLLIVFFVLRWVVTSAAHVYPASAEWKRPAVHYVLRKAPRFLGSVSPFPTAHAASVPSTVAHVAPLGIKSWAPYEAATSVASAMKDAAIRMAQPPAVMADVTKLADHVPDFGTCPAYSAETGPYPLHNQADTTVETAATLLMETVAAWLPIAAYVEEE